MIDYDKIIKLAVDAKNKHLASESADAELLDLILGYPHKEDKKDAVLVWLGGKRVWFDLHNAKDNELVYVNADNGEHYFTQENAIRAAEKAGKRLMTVEEMAYITTLPRRWDEEHKGMLFTFTLVNGGTVDIFFPAAGYRNFTSGSFFFVGSLGFCWSSSTNGNNGYYLSFSSTSVNPANSISRAFGFPVRCIAEFE